MALKPEYPLISRALAVAMDHLLFLPCSCRFLLTIFLLLLLTRSSFFRPPTVLAFFPLHTATFAFLPFATTETFFMTFMTFLPLPAFMALTALAVFIALAALFIAFIAPRDS